MREIRFRAWDIENKVMCDVSHIFIANMVIPQTIMVSVGSEMKHCPDDAILMQFTGLLDRHGKEIWEGDIVNVPYNHIGKREVKYKNGGFDIAAYKISECEVVGNIWEHPKLLKET